MRSLPYRAPSGSPASAMYQRILAAAKQAREPATQQNSPAPVAAEDRSRNPLRPRTLAEIVGQEQAKGLLRAAIRRAQTRREPLPHMLLVGAAGTGKSTFAHVVATELGVHVFQLAAPVSHDTLLELREVMHDRDVLFLDEIHQQAIQERRGREVATSPEVLYGVLEDRVIQTATGVLEFPAITMIGGTTDEGMLTDAFLSRFPLRPRLVEYTPDELAEIGQRNAKTLGARLDNPAAGIFAIASRGVPREVNNLIKNAIVFSHTITATIAREVLRVNGIEEKDGLTPDQSAMLKFIALYGRRPMADGTVRYQCSLSTIATGIGKSRDTKSIVLRIEPYLIRRGYVSILPGGRALTPTGIARASELIEQRATPYRVAHRNPAAAALASVMGAPR